MTRDAGERRAGLGFGVTGPLALSWFSEAAARRLISEAHRGGVYFFDTAPFYGDGLGERRLAAALPAAAADGAIVSTKVGTVWRGGLVKEARKDFSEAGVREQVDDSLRRLGRDRLDIVYLHGPNLEETHQGRAALRTLQAEGLINRCGVCQDHPWLLEQAVEAGVEAVMAPLNFIDRRLEAGLVAAKARGVHVAAISTLARATYAADAARIRGPADIWKRARQVVREGRQTTQAAALRDAMTAAVGDRSLTGAALAWAASRPCIDVAVVTTTKPAHLAELLVEIDKPLTPAQRAALEAAGASAGA